jgi:hypothetical protein
MVPGFFVAVSFRVQYPAPGKELRRCLPFIVRIPL